MTFNQYNVTTITQPHTASNEEYIISDGSTVTLPEPSQNAIVAVASRDGTIVPVEPNATELVEFDSVARVGTTGATYFVSDGTNWYLESGRANVFGAIPDSVTDHWPIDEGSGSILTNGVSDRDLEFVGSPTWNSDNDSRGGFDLVFDGIDDLAKNDASFWQSPTEVSMSVWVYPQNDEDHQYIMGGIDGNGSRTDNEHWAVAINQGSTDIRLNFSDDPTTSVSLSMNEWQHLAVRYKEDDGVDIFIDSSFENHFSMTGSTGSGVDAFVLGGVADASRFFFEGHLDDPHVGFEEYWSDDDIETIYEAHPRS